MLTHSRFIALCAAASLLAAPTAFAADHIDAPAASVSPSADIGDFFAWMTSDATHLNMAVTVNPFATAESMWSTATVYAMHVASMASYGGDATNHQLLCRFYKADGTGIECWAGGEYVSGDPTDPAGISSASGKIKVFAGLRNDPFFFELTGFQNAVKTVTEAAPSLTFDDDGCPAVPADTAAAIVGMLQSGSEGAPASDTLAGANVLALVVQVDKTLVNDGGDFLAAWAATHAMAQ
ncbi:MAG: hypothetical protein ACI9OJ_004463 [Myxococcota bacterium]|jgi:hypothetical protein